MAEISLQEYREQIDLTIERGQYEQAVAHGKHILKQYPKDVASYQLIGKALLNSGRGDDAVDMFRRVLSANPEDLVAWIGMSEVHSQRGEFDMAAWYLERAFEQATDNEALENELRKLYGQRDGKEPHKVQLTRGALARLYLKGDLLSRAISEFRDLLTEDPKRADLSIALAEALWRNEQRLEASEVCQKLLDELPYCIKANLILGEIWTSSGREEGQTYLQRAEALDPENQMAQVIFGAASPLQPREAHITPLEISDSIPEERPAWLTGEAEGESALADVASALETQIEIPSWLQDATGEPTIADQAPPMAPPAPITTEPLVEQPPVAQPTEEAPPASMEAVPDWLTGIGDEILEEEPGVVTADEATAPDWLADLSVEPAEPSAELEIEPAGMEEAPIAMDEEEPPDWLTELGIAPVGEEAPPSVPPQEPAADDWLAGIRDQFTEEEETLPEAVTAAVAEPEEGTPEWLEPDWLDDKAPPLGDESLSWLEQPTDVQEDEIPIPSFEAAVPTPDEIPDWMQELAPSDEAVPVAPAAEEMPTPDWLEDEGPAPAPAEIPDWMQELAPSEEAAPAAPVVEEETLAPDWLEGEGVPSGDEALAWLEQLTEGKEDELQAQAQAEAEARMAEIMGRPALAAEPTVEAVPEEAVAPPVEEAPPAPAEIPDWMQELRPPEEAAPAAPVAEEEALAPDWLEGEGVPSGDEALAWLEQLAAGKEEELQAQAQAEAEVRMAEIMGRPAPATEPVVEAVPEEAIAPPVEEAPPAPAEIPDWMQELRPPEEAVPAAPVEEEEALAPDWLEGEGVPSGDEALAWLEQLAAGKEEELQAQAQAEAEARMAEIMGRPAPAAEPTVEAVPEEAVAPPVEEAPPAPAEIPDWMQELRPPEEAVPAAPVAEEEALAPDWLEGEGVPSGDEALAWLEQLAEGKEEELQAQAQAEAEARMAEIMGRPAPAAEPTVEAAPEEIAVPPVEEAPPAPAEIPDWMQELRPPEETVPAAPVAEEEALAPDWLEGEGVPSGDEALAWLEQLAAGKEEELQAQAQAEAEARMAEIMGRPAPAAEPIVEAAAEEIVAPPVEEAPPAPAEVPDLMQELRPPEETVPAAPVAEEEALAPDWLEGEGVPSGDEALAWLEQLAAGKEEELQAQAQAEAEARMAEIMGRPAPAAGPVVEAAPEEAIAPPVEEAPPAPAEVPDWMQELRPPEEAVPAAPVVEEEALAPDWLEGEGVPSGDEALAWLEQLAAGKEEELQAQAQAEAEARMAEIMGRPAPVAKAAPEEVIAPPVEEAPLAPAEVPDLMQELGPPEEEIAPIVEAAPTPDWLEDEQVTAEPVEEAFGWTAFGEPQISPQAAAAAEAEARMAEVIEPPAPAVEAVPEEITAPPVEEIAPPEVAFVPEVAPPVEEVSREAAVEAVPEEAITPPPAVEQVPSTVEAEAPIPSAPPTAAPTPPAGPFADEKAHLKKHPRDYDAWLALAQALWQADERAESLEAYGRLIRAGKLLEPVISDLESYLRQWPGVDVQRALGDAYMKDGRLQEALEVYRRALETL